MGAQSRRKRDGGKRYLRRYRCLMYVDYSRATAQVSWVGQSNDPPQLPLYESRDIMHGPLPHHFVWFIHGVRNDRPEPPISGILFGLGLGSLASFFVG